MTAELNRRLGYNLTDAFCGFKAYRVEALKHLSIDEVGYAMPLQLWVQAAAAGLKVIELPTERNRNVELHRRVWPAVARAVAEMGVALEPA